MLLSSNVTSGKSPLVSAEDWLEGHLSTTQNVCDLLCEIITKDSKGPGESNDKNSNNFLSMYIILNPF